MWKSFTFHTVEFCTASWRAALLRTTIRIQNITWWVGTALTAHPVFQWNSFNRTNSYLILANVPFYEWFQEFEVTQSRTWFKLPLILKVGVGGGAAGCGGGGWTSQFVIHSFIHSTKLLLQRNSNRSLPIRKNLSIFRGTIYTGFSHVKYSFTKTGWEIALQTVEVIERWGTHFINHFARLFKAAPRDASHSPLVHLI